MPRRRLLLLFAFAWSFLASGPSFGQDISEPEDLLKGISADVLKELRRSSPRAPLSKALLEKANRDLDAYAQGKSGTFTFILSDVDAESSDKKNILINARQTQVRLAGQPMALIQGFLLDPSQKDQAAKLKPGSRVTATGKPWGLLSWSQRYNRYEFNFWLDKATLK